MAPERIEQKIQLLVEGKDERNFFEAYPATTPDPHVSVGVAAQKKHWNLDHEVFDGVRRFLKSLEDRPAT